MTRPSLAWLPLLALAIPATAHAANPKTAACTAAYSDAQALRDDHKLRAARDKLHVCGDSACPAFISKDCTAWAVDLEARIPSVVLSAKDAQGQPVANATVSMDGASIAQQLDGNAIEVDPGAHTFAFVAADGTRVEQPFTVLEGQKAQSVAVTLKTVASMAALEAANQAANQAGQRPVTPPPPFWTTRRDVAVASAGVGVVGLVVGGIFGALTASAISSQKNDCASPTNCPRFQQANSEHSTEGTDSAVSTAAFIAGGVLIAGGATLFFTAPRASASSSSAGIHLAPAVGPGHYALALWRNF